MYRQSSSKTPRDLGKKKLFSPTQINWEQFRLLLPLSKFWPSMKEICVIFIPIVQYTCTNVLSKKSPHPVTCTARIYEILRDEIHQVLISPTNVPFSLDPPIPCPRRPASNKRKRKSLVIVCNSEVYTVLWYELLASSYISVSCSCTSPFCHTYMPSYFVFYW